MLCILPLTPFKMQEFLINQMYSNGYQWLRHYTCSGFCKKSYHLLISPPPTNLANTLKIHTGENKIDRQGRQYLYMLTIHALFLLIVRRTRVFFQPKTFSIPRRIISQNFSSLVFAVSEELGNKQTNKHTNSLTDWCFYREIS